MSELESAQNLADRITDNVAAEFDQSGTEVDYDAIIPLIEADRAAVALAVLDDLRAMASLEEWIIPESNAIVTVWKRLCDKYAPTEATPLVDET